MVAQICNPSTQRIEAGESGVLGQHSKTLSPKNSKYIKYREIVMKLELENNLPTLMSNDIVIYG